MDDRRDDRRDEILRALVEEHIRTGEPVSSRAILEYSGLQVSGATIRNEVASLEREGYAVQPHTSAGRVPTAKAYRYYVDHLSPSRLRVHTQQRIESFFSSVHLELGRLLKATTELLSDITHYPSVAVSPGPVGEQVRAVHLVQLGARTALLVVVTHSGRVCQELCTLDAVATPVEVERAEGVLAQVGVGKDLGEDLTPALAQVEMSPTVRGVIDGALAGFVRLRTQTADIYVGGTHQMATVWDNLSTVHRVLEVLQGEARVLEIMARTPGTAIQLGNEIGLESDVDVAVVSSAFESGVSGGRVGVIGPMRMDYKKVISAVEGVSRELGERIGP